MAAELEAVSAQRDALAARVAELEARPSDGSGGAERAVPPTVPPARPEAADSARGNGRAASGPRARRGTRATCGSPDAAKFRFVAGSRLASIAMPPDGRQTGELWLCGKHQEEMTERLGAEVDLDPAGDGDGDGDPFGFRDVGRCQFPVRAGVPV